MKTHFQELINKELLRARIIMNQFAFLLIFHHQLAVNKPLLKDLLELLLKENLLPRHKGLPFPTVSLCASRILTANL